MNGPLFGQMQIWVSVGESETLFRNLINLPTDTRREACRNSLPLPNYISNPCPVQVGYLEPPVKIGWGRR